MLNLRINSHVNHHRHLHRVHHYHEIQNQLKRVTKGQAKDKDKIQLKTIVNQNLYSLLMRE